LVGLHGGDMRVNPVMRKKFRRYTCTVCLVVHRTIKPIPDLRPPLHMFPAKMNSVGRSMRRVMRRMRSLRMGSLGEMGR